VGWEAFDDAGTDSDTDGGAVEAAELTQKKTIMSGVARSRFDQG
jgi:hypothetical protein